MRISDWSSDVCSSDLLGPTSDDLTKPCLAKYLDCEMRIHEEALAEVTAFFISRGRALTEVNRLQDSLPVCCEKIMNRMGTDIGRASCREGGCDEVYILLVVVNTNTNIINIIIY